MNRSQVAVAVFSKVARQYQDKYMDVSLYSDMLDKFCSCLRSNDASILELACGPGNITKYLLSQKPDLKIIATDLSPAMLDLARANNPDADFRIMDCREMDTLEEKFDAIVCGFCFPYLDKDEVTKLISDAPKRLLPKGVLYISTMEGDYSSSRFQTASSGDQVYVYYHEAAHIIQSLEQNGFKIIDVARKVYMLDNAEVNDLILIAGLDTKDI